MQSEQAAVAAKVGGPFETPVAAAACRQRKGNEEFSLVVPHGRLMAQDEGRNPPFAKPSHAVQIRPADTGRENRNDGFTLACDRLGFVAQLNGPGSHPNQSSHFTNLTLPFKGRAGWGLPTSQGPGRHGVD